MGGRLAPEGIAQFTRSPTPLSVESCPVNASLRTSRLSGPGVIPARSVPAGSWAMLDRSAPWIGLKLVSTSTQQLVLVLFQRGDRSISSDPRGCQLSFAITVLLCAPFTLLPVVRLFTLPGKSLSLAERRKPKVSLTEPP